MEDVREEVYGVFVRTELQTKCETRVTKDRTRMFEALDIYNRAKDKIMTFYTSRLNEGGDVSIFILIDVLRAAVIK